MKKNTKSSLKNLLIQISNRVVGSVQKRYKEYVFDIKQSEIDVVFSYYEQLKNDTKKIISVEEFKQDRHKIASVFVFSILSVPFIEVVKHPKTITKEEAEKWLHYNIALLFANEIIFSFNDKKMPFKYPPTYTDRPYKEYLMALIHSMNEDINHKVPFNKTIANYINSLSNIFFLLEYITIKEL